SMSTSYLLSHIRIVPLRAYAGLVIITLLIFSLVDQPGRGRDYCQKAAIRQIRDTKGAVIQIGTDCQVLTWENVTDFHDSRTSMDMLRYWNIIKEEKLFYQK